jgi:chloride channel 3/4/5
LELVQQFFVKLGSRYVVVIDSNGFCKFGFPFHRSAVWGSLSNNLADEGIIDKNGWLAFLGELETKAH